WRRCSGYRSACSPHSITTASPLMRVGDEKGRELLIDINQHSKIILEYHPSCLIPRIKSGFLAARSTGPFARSLTQERRTIVLTPARRELGPGLVISDEESACQRPPRAARVSRNRFH